MSEIVWLSLPKWAKWCQPGDRQDERYYLVRFEDPDCREGVFTDWDEAKSFYAKATTSYNCWLFAAVPAEDVRGGETRIAQLERDLAEARAELKTAKIDVGASVGIEALLEKNVAELEAAANRAALPSGEQP